MRKYVCVMQDGIKDCGVCSLLTIIKSYGGNVPREYLRMITNTTNDGVNAFSLLEAGRKLGFDAKGVNGSVFDIDKKFLPCIAHVIIDGKYKHFVVIHEINMKAGNLILADPAKGIVKMKIEDFLKITTSNFLFLTPNKKIPFIKPGNEIKSLVFNFLYMNKNILLMIAFLSILYTISNILTSFNFQFIIEKALTYQSKSNLYFIVFLMILLYILKNTADYMRNRLLNFVSHKLDYILISNTFSHVLLLPHLYYKNRTTGEVISRINDLGEIRDSISHLIVTFLVDTVLLFFVIFFLFSISVTLSFIVLFSIIIYICFTIFFNKLIYHRVRAIKENEAFVHSYMIELISGVDSVRGMNVFDTVMDKFSYLYNKYLLSSYHFSFFANLQKFVDNVFVSLLMMVLVFVGSIMVMNNELSLGNLITYHALIYYFLEPIRNIIHFDIILKKARIVVDRINEILAMETDDLLSDSNAIMFLDGDIVIKDLSYSYNGRDFLFKNLSFSLKKGEKIVICGESGRGKSTLAKIIARYIPIPRNFVFVDGKDINDINLWALRECVTYVSQNEILFTDTIYNNINMNNTRDYNRVSDVCKYTLVDEVVKDRNLGYYTLLEENGANISGGERQRIILARTFLKNSNVYILDESFSEIDVNTEKKIILNLLKYYSSKTIIVISHRKDNNYLYDKVIDMENFIYENS